MGGGPSKPLSVSLKHCTLWKADRSPACRAVMMALDAMNIDVREVDVNMDKEEHKSPQFIAMNPLQTLPILKDGDLVLCDSHAIAAYMTARYGSQMSRFLLPREPGKGAVVHQFLHLNSGVLYPLFKAASDPILYNNVRSVSPQRCNEIECSYHDLESLLERRAWFSSGTWPSLGDIMLAATVSTLDVLVPIDPARFPKLSGWLQRMSEEKFYTTANKKGLSEFARRIGSSNIDEEVKCPRNSEDQGEAATKEPTLQKSKEISS